MDFKAFCAGSGDYRPLALWSLNHELEPEEMTRQIGEMAQKGLQGFILHARSGLLTPYLSERWFSALEHAILEAARHGLKAWLYDEDPYPSGIAGGRVTADHPEFRAQMLGVERASVQGPGKVTMDMPLRRLELAVAVRLVGGEIAETVDLSAHIGILRQRWQQSKAYHTYYPTTDSKAAPQYRADTEDPRWRLDWDAPDGDWRVFVFCSRPCGKFWLFDSYTDLLNPDAVDYFMQTTYLPYERRFGKYFGTVVPGMFIDEPKFISDPYPWTGRLPEEFLKRKGYALATALPAMELDTADSPRIRRDFWDVVESLFNESYTAKLEQWCRRNSLKLIGHNSPEEEPGDQVYITGNLMRFLRHLDMPGTDLITRQIGDRRHPIVNLGPKLAASVARQWGDGKALCEAYGVMEWRLDLADMAWIANWLFTLGVNVISPHTFIYSIDSLRKKDAAPSEFYQAPYWEHFRAYSDHLAQLGYLLGDADPCAGTALIYPFDSFQSLQMLHNGRCNALRDRFAWLFDTLLRSHVQFELADMGDLADGIVEEGCLAVGNRRYRQVVLPPLAYVSTALEAALDKLAAAGVTVAAPAGLETAYLETEKQEIPLEDIGALRKATLRYAVEGCAASGFSAHGLQAVLEACRGPMELCSEPSCDILLSHSTKDGRHVFFLFNPTESAAALKARLRLDKQPSLELWDSRNAQPLPLEADESGLWPVTIPPRGAVALVSAEAALPKPSASRTEPTALLFPGTWQATPARRNCLTLDRWLLEQGDEVDPADIDFRRGLPVVELGLESQNRHYPATLWYKAVVHLEGTPERMALVLEQSAARHVTAVFCNGLPCGKGTPCREYDCNNVEFALTPEELEAGRKHFYKKDEAVIAVRVQANGPEDCLIEPLRLFGHFRARLNAGESLGATLAAATFPQAMQAGSWSQQGFPHYSGIMLYEQDVQFDEALASRRCILFFDVGDCSAEVFVNGKPAGMCAWAPYEMDVTGLLKPGTNRIGLGIANTLEPLLYGSGKPAGILGPSGLRFD